MKKYIIAIDQGTTSTRACLIDKDGMLQAVEQKEFPQYFPQPGWVEHDGEQIWQSVNETLEPLIRKHAVCPDEVAGIGITNQRETVLAWDSQSGKCLAKAIVWQCRRTEEFCTKLKKKGLEREIQRRTGLVIDPYFSASKMNWLLKNNKEVAAARKRGTLKFGTVDSFLIWRLSGGRDHLTDVTNASRTQLMNLESLDWDEKMLKIFNILRKELPRVTSSSGPISKYGNIPISGVAGDQQAALFGQACFGVGEAKCTFGTGSFILLNTGKKIIRSRHRLLTTVAWKIQNQPAIYALEGSAFICGAAVQWLRDGLGLIKTSTEIEELANSVSSSEGVVFVPALSGLGAPHWKPRAKGLLTGLSRGATKAHVAYAVLESLAMQNAELTETMSQELGRKLGTIKVDGGAAENNLLMQMQANFSAVKVIRPKIVESTVMGVGFLAGLGVGFWTRFDEINKNWKMEREFSPLLSKEERKLRFIEWNRAIKKCEP